MRETRHTLTRVFKNSAGVSLIEVLIAVAIFAIGISAVAVLQYKTVGGNLRGRMITDATTLAEREAERLMGLTYCDSDLDTANHTAAGVPAPYTVEWTVSEVDLDLDSGTGMDLCTPPGTVVTGFDVKKIELTVTAPQLGGNRDISFVFYKDNLK